MVQVVSKGEKSMGAAKCIPITGTDQGIMPSAMYFSMPHKSYVRILSRCSTNIMKQPAYEKRGHLVERTDS